MLHLLSVISLPDWTRECKCCCQARDENITLSLNPKLLASASHPAIEAPVAFTVAWQPHTIDMVMVGYILTCTHTHSQNRNVYRLTMRPQALSEPQHKDHHLDSAFPSTGNCRHWLYAICLSMCFVCGTRGEFIDYISEVNKSKHLDFSTCSPSIPISPKTVFQGTTP